MDYKGQVDNEMVYQIIFALFGIISFLTGWYVQDFNATFQGWAGSLVVAFLICVPDWPFFNRHKINWVGEGSTASSALSADEIEQIKAEFSLEKPGRGGNNNNSGKKKKN